MEDFDYADFVSEERIVPEEKLGKYNLPFISFPVVFLFLFVINFGTAPFLAGVDEYFTLPNLFLVFTGGFLVHETLHFLCWQALTRYPIQEFRMGIRWNSFTPVIGCQRPMKLFPFRAGLLFPLLLMGVTPLAMAFWLGNTWLLFSGCLFVSWASADILTFILVWNSPADSMVEMHRKGLGAILYNRKPEIVSEPEFTQPA